MGDQKDRRVVVLHELVDPLLALLLEQEVADRERLIDDQDVRIGDRSDCKGDACDHAGGVVLERHLHEVLELGEFHDVVELLVDELLRIAEEGTVKIDVLLSRELRVETGAKLDQWRNRAIYRTGALRCLKDASDDLEHRRLARAVRADKTECLALVHIERDVVEGTELLEGELVLHDCDEVFLEGVELLRRDIEDHRDIVDTHCDIVRKLCISHGSPMPRYRG